MSLARRNWMHLLAILTVVFATTIARAGHEIGNGGDALVCRNAAGAILRAEIVDYYEAKVLRDIDVDLGPNAAWTDQFEYVMKRLERLDPTRAARLRAGAATFLADSRFIAAHEFPDIPDTGGLIVPTGCKIEQIAIQQKPDFPQDKPYLINQDLWSVFDERSRAGLVLHELLYREAIENYHAVNSRKARYLNSVIASPLLEKMETAEYVDLLARAEFFEFRFWTKMNGEQVEIPLKLGKCVPGLGGGTYCESWTSADSELTWVSMLNPSRLSILDSAGKPKKFSRFSVREGGSLQAWNREGSNSEFKESRFFIDEADYFFAFPQKPQLYSFIIAVRKEDLTDDDFQYRSSRYGSLGKNPYALTLAFDSNGELLDDLPLFCGSGLFNPFEKPWYDYDYADLILTETKAVECGKWSGTALSIEALKPGWEIDSRPKQIQISGAIKSLAVTLQGTRYSFKLKSSCKDPRGVTFHRDSQKWVYDSKCYDLETSQD